MCNRRQHSRNKIVSAHPSGEFGATHRHLRAPGEPGGSQVTPHGNRHEMLSNRSLARSGLFLMPLCANDPVQRGKHSRNLICQGSGAEPTGSSGSLARESGRGAALSRITGPPLRSLRLFPNQTALAISLSTEQAVLCISIRFPFTKQVFSELPANPVKVDGRERCSTACFVGSSTHPVAGRRYSFPGEICVGGRASPACRSWQDDRAVRGPHRDDSVYPTLGGAFNLGADWAEAVMQVILRHCPICAQDSIVGHGRRRKQAHDQHHDWIGIRASRTRRG